MNVFLKESNAEARPSSLEGADRLLYEFTADYQANAYQSNDVQTDTAQAYLSSLEVLADNENALECFDALSGEPLALDTDASSQIDAAMQAFSQRGFEAGFVLYDLSAQKMMASNANESFFGASVTKAPFAAYLIQEYVLEGMASLDDELAKDVYVIGTGSMDSEGQSSYPLSEVIERTVVESDNTGYAMLREHFGKSAREGLSDGVPSFSEWAQSVGASGEGLDDAEYPCYTPADLARCWLGIASCLSSGSDEGRWLAEVLGATQHSFLRDSLGAEGNVVLSKPGYEVTSAYYNTSPALNDAGLLFDGEHLYLLVIMSSAEYDDAFLVDDQELFNNLAQALYAAAQEWKELPSAA